jgi:hypothetical protein
MHRLKQYDGLLAYGTSFTRTFDVWMFIRVHEGKKQMHNLIAPDFVIKMVTAVEKR